MHALYRTYTRVTNLILFIVIVIFLPLSPFIKKPYHNKPYSKTQIKIKIKYHHSLTTHESRIIHDS